MKQNGSPEPVFETDADRNYFLTVLPVHAGTKPGPSKDIREKEDVELSWDQVGTKLELSRGQVKKILLKCRESTKIEELMDLFGRSKRTKFRNKFIRKLILGKCIL